MTIGGGELGAGLTEIIEAGDVINRATLTPQQLRRGLAKLIFEEHVRREGERFVLAGIARIAYRDRKASLSTSYDLLQFYEDLLQAAPYPAGEADVEDPFWNLADLTDEVVAVATGAYDRERASLRRDAEDA